MIANSVLTLLRHPDAWERIRRDPGVRDNAIEETLRWSPSVQSCTRHTTQEVDISGVRIPGGEVVQGMLGAANRDPGHFAGPRSIRRRAAQRRGSPRVRNGTSSCVWVPHLPASRPSRCSSPYWKTNLRWGSIPTDRRSFAAMSSGSPPTSGSPGDDAARQVRTASSAQDERSVAGACHQRDLEGRQLDRLPKG